MTAAERRQAEAHRAEQERLRTADPCLYRRLRYAHSRKSSLYRHLDAMCWLITQDLSKETTRNKIKAHTETAARELEKYREQRIIFECLYRNT